MLLDLLLLLLLLFVVVLGEVVVVVVVIIVVVAEDAVEPVLPNGGWAGVQVGVTVVHRVAAVGVTGRFGAACRVPAAAWAAAARRRRRQYTSPVARDTTRGGRPGCNPARCGRFCGQRGLTVVTY